MKSKFENLKWYKFDTRFYNVVYTKDNNLVGDASVYFGVKEFVDVNGRMSSLINHNILKFTRTCSSYVSKKNLVAKIESLSKTPELIYIDTVLENIDGIKLSYKHRYEALQKINATNMGTLSQMMFNSTVVFAIHDNKMIPLKNRYVSVTDNLNFKKSIK